MPVGRRRSVTGQLGSNRRRTVQIEARTRALTSIDRITIADDGEGCLVTYDARLDLNGTRRVLDPLLRLVFGRIGDRAAAGLESTLDGARAMR